MTPTLQTVIIPVTDLAAAKQTYAALLGVEPTVDEPYYVGFDAGSQHLGLDPNGHRSGLAGPVSYWQVDAIEPAIAALVAAGATPHQPVRDVGGGKLIASVTDPDGNVIGVLQPRPGGQDAERKY
jgi:predicted enzyme related to lactoylglutathione lyase